MILPEIYLAATKLNGFGAGMAVIRSLGSVVVVFGGGGHKMEWGTKQDSVSRADSVPFRSPPVPCVNPGDKTMAMLSFAGTINCGPRNRRCESLHCRQ